MRKFLMGRKAKTVVRCVEVVCKIVVAVPLHEAVEKFVVKSKLKMPDLIYPSHSKTNEINSIGTFSLIHFPVGPVAF